MELKREAYAQESTGITKNKCYKEKIITFKKEVLCNSDYVFVSQKSKEAGDFLHKKHFKVKM